MQQESVNVLIIGAGPAGCVAAAYLQQKGIKVKVVEKAKFPRFSIGESLLPRCMDHFEEVGLLDCLKSKGYQEKRGARFIRGNTICNFDFSEKFTDGYDWTWQVPRADFDHTLAKEVAKKGTEIVFEAEVIGVQFDEKKSYTTIKYKNKEQKVVHSDFIIDSSGFGRVLPKILGLAKPAPLSKNASIFTHIKEERRPEGKEGTLISFDILETQVWLWVIPFSNGITSIGVVGPTEFIQSFKGNTTEILSELLQLSGYFYERFKGLDFLFTPYKLQNLAKGVSQIYGDGYALTGNSAQFLDPVFSSGVSFATESGLLAAKLATREINGETVDWEKEYAQYLNQGADTFGSYVKEWYTGNLQKLFFHSSENEEVKRKICAVLAGYVWDKTNPFVRKHNRIIKSLAHLIDMNYRY